MSAAVEQVAPANVLVVDDTPADLDMMASALEQWGHQVRRACSGRMALEAVHEDPPDLILLDTSLPDISGSEVCALLKADETLRTIPVIFILSPAEYSSREGIFSIGGVDYITRPIGIEEVRARVGTHLKLQRLRSALETHQRLTDQLAQAQAREGSEVQMATIFALARLSESRDEDTTRHLERVQTFCRLLATKLAEGPKYRASITQSFTENLFHASPLHDVGKVVIPDAILLKPDMLTDAEFELTKKHTLIGAYALGLVRERYQNNGFINMAVAIARSHHERWDGSGYPDRLAGEAIPLPARIIALADVYDALRTKRAYKPPYSHEEACESILRGSRSHFDPTILDAFKELERQFRDTWEVMRG